MAISRVAPRILREEYDAFLALLENDFDFPKTYDQWLKSSANELEKLRMQGMVRELTIHPAEFTNWCALSGFNPSFPALQAFANAKGNRKI